MTAKSKTTKTAPASKPRRPAPTPAKKTTAKTGAKLTMSMTTGKITVKKPRKVVDPAREAERAARYPSAAKAAATKAATKPAPAPEIPFTPRTAPDGVPRLVVSIDARPRSGAALYAHTRAAMTAIGMMGDKRPNVSERVLTTMIGSRAIKHHLGENNFARGKGDMIHLTAAGLAMFRSRKMDNAKANAFVNLFVDGKVSAGLGISKADTFAPSF